MKQANQQSNFSTGPVFPSQWHLKGALFLKGKEILENTFFLEIIEKSGLEYSFYKKVK